MSKLIETDKKGLKNLCNPCKVAAAEIQKEISTMGCGKSNAAIEYECNVIFMGPETPEPEICTELFIKSCPTLL